MPEESNIVPFSRPEPKKRSEKEMFELLSRIDELEEALEIMDEVGVTTRDELDALIGQLEAEAAAQDDPDS